MTLYTRHDLLSLNEIFCRLDYGNDAPQVVVDVGANVGLASLFWLTRRPDSRVFAYEPNPRNVERLRESLQAFADRVEVVEAAVATFAGTAEFVADDTGRYGRLRDGSLEGFVFEVRTVALEDELERICAVVGKPVDLIKLDTEGTERTLLNSLSAPHPPVVWEDEIGRIHETPK